MWQNEIPKPVIVFLKMPGCKLIQSQIIPVGSLGKRVALSYLHINLDVIANIICYGNTWSF